MLEINIPGREPLKLDHLVLDYNGTIAKDGKLIPSVPERLVALSAVMQIHVLTADTFCSVESECRDLPVAVHTFPKENAAQSKLEIVNSLSGGVVCVGNGFNDILMFDAASLSVAVMDEEGVCTALLPHADVLVASPAAALDLLIKKDRLRATLRT